MLEIRLFGGFDINWDGEPIASNISATARSLLTYLITFCDRSHTRDLLAGTFWPDASDNNSRRRLSQAIWQIRRALEPHSILHVEGEIIQFKSDVPLWIDLEVFRESYALMCGETTQSLELGETCTEIFRGEFLAGYYDDWVLTERERLRNMHLVTLGN